MSLLAHFSAVLVATNTPAPHPMTAKVELAAKLTRAKTMKIAEKACSIDWEPDGDAWWSCVVGLESWRCEVQGWCTPAAGYSSTLDVMPLPDPAWAGTQDWDAL